VAKVPITHMSDRSPEERVPRPRGSTGGTLAARIICSPALQNCYMRVRRVPMFGELGHRLVERFLPPGKRLDVTVREGLGAGLSLSIDPRYEAPYAAGLHENALLGYLASHLRRGDVFYDVGAHIGYVALVAARLVGPEGSVFAFEPDPENSLRVIRHARMNALPQIEVICSAVWSECTAMPFHRGADSSSRNTGVVIESPKHANVGEVISVPAVTIDRFAQEHRAPRVIKIDVEGAEGDVLIGAEAVLRGARPILICEIHGDRALAVVTKWVTEREYHWDWLSQGEGFPRHLVAQVRN
jgi:FkbM family methyltransferase